MAQKSGGTATTPWAPAVSVDARMVVTGLGMRTAAGNNAAQSAASVRAGIGRCRAWPRFPVSSGGGNGDGDDHEGESLLAGFTEPDLGDAAWSAKVEDLLPKPLFEALATAGLLQQPHRAAQGDRRAGLFIATPSNDRPGSDRDSIAEARQAMMEILAEAGLAEISIELFPFDETAGLWALARGVEALAQGELEVCIIAGIDSLLDSMYLQQLLARGRLKTPDFSFGLVPGEGAACLVIESAAHAAERGAKVLAQIASIAIERGRLLGPDAPIDGASLSRAVSNALEAAKSGGAVHRVIVDLTGERWRFLEWSLVEARCLSALPADWQLWHPAESLGATGAAYGVIAAGLAVRAFARGYAGQGSILVSASSAVGQRAAVVLVPPPATDEPTDEAAGELSTLPFISVAAPGTRAQKP